MTTGVFYREAGSGPTVLCLHASASSCGQWRPLMESLLAQFRVVTPDLYGYGKSPDWPNEHPFRLDDEIALLAPILDTADKFHLIGHSYGGLVALKLALNDPTRIASLTLYEPVCFFLLMASDPQDPASLEIVAIRDDTNRLVDAGNLELAGQRFVAYWTGPEAWSELPVVVRQTIARGMGKVRFEWSAAFDHPLSPDSMAALPMPVLLLSGNQTTAAALGVMRLLKALLPQAESIDLPGLGHMGPVTHPEQVNEGIAAFLMRVGS